MKRAATIVALAAVLAGLAAILAMFALNPIAGWAVGRWGTELTGAPVEAEEVILQPYRGFARITGLEIGKPAGFTSRTAHLKELAVRLDASTLLSDVILVHELSVDALQVTYERADRAGTNLDAIQRSIQAHVKRAEAGAAGGGNPAPRGRRYVVEKLTIRNVRVVMTTKGLGGQGLSFPVPDVELRDVGRKQGGASASQVAELVASTVQQKIALKLLSNVDALRRGGLEGAIDALRSLAR